ncbi:zinc-binding dehydrogenase [Alicyclobacillus fastidiosus]|uniref:Zinc-binding dehydrogenase n=1 Tax=Alicyclobacillus fastidiosus TaxID=392011 RepID=A0ABY6ZAD4_9BACL|nr:zinc-binding dehydrogenase [Alicyclobacillus fastidiosus]WAH39826.1 zinc-binding dehydrogenase [Alicyclobacillus fastidiosus]GMA61083.1 hypothetical protein GCM10025859_15230 [Alicyclobacillus fastidiosus]
MKSRLAFCKSWCKIEGTIHALHQPEQTISELTNGEYPTLVFDATGNAKSMKDSIHYVAHGGGIVYVRLVQNDISFSDPGFHKRELTLLGS